MEAQLRSEHDQKVAKFNAEQDKERAALEREKENLTKSLSFKTKEARYLAREQVDKMLSQIEGWIKDWGLTKGTQRKRWPVTIGYWLAVGGAGYLTFFFGAQSAEVLARVEPSANSWWQWILLAVKPVGALAIATSFMVYNIRWSQVWARQHADEEFRNRARILDVGRAAWLLEAVRDAQDHDDQLPENLVKELSRNLFNAHGGEPIDMTPQGAGELFMKGLSSLRVKTGVEGTEVEATKK